MNCPHCGAGNPAKGKFCRKCGKPLAAQGLEEKLEPETKFTPVVDLAAPPQNDIQPNSYTEPVPPGPERPMVTAEGGKHQDPICPHCGGTDCQPVSRTTGTAKGGGYSISNGCCGMCMLGPIGLLCGLCGSGSKMDLKSEVVWVCRSCGKEHLSQKDALEKATALATSYGMGAAIIGLILSIGVHVSGWPWLLAVAWAFSPLLVYGMVAAQIEEELGYPMEEILPPSVSIPTILIAAEVIMVLLLWLGGPMVNDFFEGL